MCNQSAPAVVMLLPLYTLITLTRTTYTMCIQINNDYAALRHFHENSIDFLFSLWCLAPHRLELKGILSYNSTTTYTTIPLNLPRVNADKRTSSQGASFPAIQARVSHRRECQVQDRDSQGTIADEAATQESYFTGPRTRSRAR